MKKKLKTVKNHSRQAFQVIFDFLEFKLNH